MRERPISILPPLAKTGTPLALPLYHLETMSVPVPGVRVP